MYVDLHCDTIIKAINSNRSLYDTVHGALSIKELLKNKVLAQFFAIYLYDEDYPDNPNLSIKGDWQYIELCVNYLKNLEREFPEKIDIVNDFSKYFENKTKNKLSIFITIEDGRVIHSYEDIDRLSEFGISLVTLLWNKENSIGYPHSYTDDSRNNGLKPFGIEAIERMEDKNIIVDVSHSSDKVFWDVFKYSKRPFFASHSNARSVTPHSRNLDDTMIKAIAEKGGLMGVNLFPEFLSRDPKKHFHKKNLLRHIFHIINVGGEDIISIGSDFDGIYGELEINNPTELNDFLNDLEQEGLKPSVVDKIRYRNFERFIREY